jgi:hypothetical protein
MLTIEALFGPEALDELFSIPLEPFERKIGDLLLDAYRDGVITKPPSHDPLPAYYRKLQINA